MGLYAFKTQIERSRSSSFIWFLPCSKGCRTGDFRTNHFTMLRPKVWSSSHLSQSPEIPNLALGSGTGSLASVTAGNYYRGLIREASRPFLGFIWFLPRSYIGYWAGGFWYSFFCMRRLKVPSSSYLSQSPEIPIRASDSRSAGLASVTAERLSTRSYTRSELAAGFIWFYVF